MRAPTRAFHRVNDRVDLAAHDAAQVHPGTQALRRSLLGPPCVDVVDGTSHAIERPGDNGNAAKKVVASAPISGVESDHDPQPSLHRR